MEYPRRLLGCTCAPSQWVQTRSRHWFAAGALTLLALQALSCIRHRQGCQAFAISRPAASAEGALLWETTRAPEDDDARMIEAVGLAYDAQRIEAYFSARPYELATHATSIAWTIVRLLLGAVAGAAGAALSNSVAPSATARDIAWVQFRKRLAPEIADALVTLGPAYIKFGQSLASRPDLISNEIAAELQRLQDSLPPFDAAIAQRILAHELTQVSDRTAADELLASLSHAVPVAAASLGQVYKGRIGSRDVAVKVQRPSVRRIAAADAALLKLLARAVANLRLPQLFGTGGASPLVRADVVGAVDEFCSRLFEELDYTREADNLERFRRLYTEGGVYAARIPPPGLRVPRLERGLCTRRVLVMEWLDGERLVSTTPDGCAIVDEADGALIQIGLKATLLQLLETGVMHTDPHGGNLLKGPVMPQSGCARTSLGRFFRWPWSRPVPVRQLVYLDFGLVADVPLQVRDGLVCAVMYIVQRRWINVASLFNQLMLLPDWVLADEATMRSFTRDLEAAADSALDFGEESEAELLGASGSVRMPRLRFAALLEQLALLAPRYEFRLPPYFLNNARALGCLEGMARAADPGFNILREMYPFALRKLLVNGASSPVLQNTLRDLVTDAHTGRLSGRAALDLAKGAAALQGVPRRVVLFDTLRTRGGRALAAQVVLEEVRTAVARVLEHPWILRQLQPSARRA